MTPRPCPKARTLPITAAVAAAAVLGCAVATPARAQDAESPPRNAYFGDLHVHSGDSFDAAALGVLVDPELAYRFARGEAVRMRGRLVERNAALDFLAVTDHSEYMGVVREARDADGRFADTDWPEILRSNDPETADRRRRILQSGFYDADPIDEFLTEDIKRDNWQAVIDLADEYYAPGDFTTFAGYEWSPTPDGNHHHRVVVFPGPEYPEVPFSSIDSTRPEDLWAYAERNRAEGVDSIMIPHNPNLSGGLTFAYTDSDGELIDADYAETRARNETVVEITQIKGTSETHPELSPRDPFADFEIIDHYSGETRGPFEGSYVRNAYARGLETAERTGVNPFAFGVIGSSDYHTAVSGTEEDNRTVALGGDDPSNPERLFEQFNSVLRAPTIAISASGIAGVWAEANTRSAIFAALKRREVFGTSGPRIQARLFAGWRFAGDLVERGSWAATAYAEGVPMGGDISSGPAEAGALRFAVEAARAPNGANLDRIQIVKVWRENGRSREKVFDVAWSGDRERAADGLVPPVGTSVDLETATYRNDIGAATLATVWEDPEFDPAQPAVYYARVLEIPTPRWTTYTAVRGGVPLPDTVPATLQERAWTSPVFYRP